MLKGACHLLLLLASCGSWAKKGMFNHHFPSAEVFLQLLKSCASTMLSLLYITKLTDSIHLYLKL